MEDHKHCFVCGKMLPPYQLMCVKCVEESMKLEMLPRKPYYKEFVEDVRRSTQNGKY